EDLTRGGQRGLLLGGGLSGLDLLGDDLVAQLDALLADVHPRPRDQALDLLLRLAAEGALENVSVLARTCHSCPPPRRSGPSSLPAAPRVTAQARCGQNDGPAAAGPSWSIVVRRSRRCGPPTRQRPSAGRAS